MAKPPLLIRQIQSQTSQHFQSPRPSYVKPSFEHWTRNQPPPCPSFYPRPIQPNGSGQYHNQSAVNRQFQQQHQQTSNNNFQHSQCPNFNNFQQNRNLYYDKTFVPPRPTVPKPPTPMDINNIDSTNQIISDQCDYHLEDIEKNSYCYNDDCYNQNYYDYNTYENQIVDNCNHTQDQPVNVNENENEENPNFPLVASDKC